jgi:two-component system, NtrC family, response regulator HydG
MARILIVDDDEPTRYIITYFLQSHGHDCTAAEDVAEACRHLEEKSFDLIVSDFNMPSQTGLDLLMYLSSNSPATSFILMSGEIDSCLRRKALELGALACIAKPFRLHQFLTIVEDALQRHACLPPVPFGIRHRFISGHQAKTAKRFGQRGGSMR